MKQSAISKRTIIIVVVLLAGALVYFYTSGSGTPAGSYAAVKDVGGIGAQELALLGQVQGLQVNTTFFDSDVFGSLEDYVVSIRTEKVSRPNPFAPVDGVPSPFSTEPTPNQRTSR